ncbi:hypothetical protein IX332_001180 [Porphyromonas levii]|nr:hypothetical protein [Porphyromonas levii]
MIIYKRKFMNIIAKHGSALVLSLMCLSLAFGLGSCVKDRSTLPDSTSIPLVEIEGGENKDLTVEYQGTLIVEPKVKASESTNLAYRWTLTTTSNPSKIDKDTISEAPVLDYVMKREKSTSPYTLTFTVIDRDHNNLEYSTSWNVYVNGIIISGLVIADTEDGVTSNLSYIKSSDLSRTYSGEEKRMMHLFGNETYIKIPSLVSRLTYSIEGSNLFSHTPRLWAVTKDGKLTLYDVDNDNFKVKYTSEDQSIFLYKSEPSTFKVHNLLVTGPVLSAYTSEGVYTLTPRSGTSQFSLPIDLKSKPSNGIIAGQNFTNIKEDVACWYDEDKGALVTLTRQDKWGNVFGSGSFESSDKFDPQKLPNHEALAIEIEDSKPMVYALLKNKIENKHVIYASSLQTKNSKGDDVKGKAVGKYSFDENGESTIKEAKSLFFTKKGAKVLYAVTATDVFAFTFGEAQSVAKRSESLYKLPQGEEFQFGKLFVQGEYSVEAQNLGILRPKPAELPLNLQAIILVSGKTDNKNTIRIIPVDKEKLGTGTLVTETDKILTYDGFNKVLDVIHIGQ